MISEYLVALSSDEGILVGRTQVRPVRITIQMINTFYIK